MSSRDEPATVPPPPGEDDAYSAATKVGAMPAEVMAKLRAEGLLPDEDEAAAEEPAPPPSQAAPRPRLAPRMQQPSSEPIGPMPMLYSTAPPSNNAPVTPGLQQLPPPQFAAGVIEDEDEKTRINDPLIAEAFAQHAKQDDLQMQNRFQPPPSTPHGSSSSPPNVVVPTPHGGHYPAEITPAEPLLETPIAFSAPPRNHLHGSGTTPIEFPVVSLPPAMTPPSQQPHALPPLQQPSSVPPSHPAHLPPPAPFALADESRAFQQEARAFGGARKKKSQIITIVVGILVVLLFLFGMALLSQRR